MSTFIGVLFVIVGLVAAIMKKTAKGGPQQPPDEQNLAQHRPSQPRPRPPQYRVEQAPERPVSYQVQSQGETLMYKGMKEDWIRPVEPSVKNELSDLQESKHEIVHETVHESLHVRRDRNDPSAAPAMRHQGQFPVDKAHLVQALILGEALGDPRSKRPWKPNRNR